MAADLMVIAGFLVRDDHFWSDTVTLLMDDLQYYKTNYRLKMDYTQVSHVTGSSIFIDNSHLWTTPTLHSEENTGACFQTTIGTEYWESTTMIVEMVGWWWLMIDCPWIKRWFISSKKYPLTTKTWWHIMVSWSTLGSDGSNYKAPSIAMLSHKCLCHPSINEHA